MEARAAGVEMFAPNFGFVCGADEKGPELAGVQEWFQSQLVAELNPRPRRQHPRLPAAARRRAMASEDNLVGFFFYVLFVYPAVSWVLKPGRFSARKGLTYAILLLVGIAACKTAVDVVGRGPNHYSLLGVTRASSATEIKRAYKKLSLELHPDKNPSPNAMDEFERMKSAYDTLMDMELRDVYDKFGAEGVKANRRLDEYQLLVEIAVYYATWGVLAYILTLGKSSSGARSWVFTGQIVMLVLEVSLMLQELKLPGWFLPRATEHEMVWLLHELFPAYMNGCRCLGSFLYVDTAEQTKQMLLAIHEQHKEIVLALRSLQAQVSAGAGRAVGPALSPGPTAKLKELELELRTGSKAGAIAPAQAQASLVNASKPSYWYFYGMLVMYIVLFYAFG